MIKKFKILIVLMIVAIFILISSIVMLKLMANNINGASTTMAESVGELQKKYEKQGLSETDALVKALNEGQKLGQKENKTNSKMYTVVTNVMNIDIFVIVVLIILIIIKFVKLKRKGY